MPVKNYALLSVLFILFSSGVFLLRNTPLQVDEKDYYPQIIRFANGDYTVDPNITALPTYHFIQALFCKITGLTSISFLRFINVLFSLAAIIVFMQTCKLLKPGSELVQTLLFAFLPFVFPYFFLIYTDILSLLLVLLAFYFLIKNQYQWCGLLSIASCCIRQNNIVWLALFFALSYMNKNGNLFSINLMISHVKKYWSFLLGIILFVVFVIINKGIAVGDKSMHPPFSLQLGNVYFLLFLHFILFLPLHISHAPKIVRFIGQHKITLLAILIFFTVFMFTFHNTHPYNTQWGNYFLRNRLLILFSSTTVHKTIFFFPVCYALLSLCVTPLKNKYFWLTYPAVILFLLPSWLIEQRYYIIPFTLFLFIKKENNKWIDAVTLTLFVGLSAFFFFMIRSNTHFI